MLCIRLNLIQAFLFVQIILQIEIPYTGDSTVDNRTLFRLDLTCKTDKMETLR